MMGPAPQTSQQILNQRGPGPMSNFMQSNNQHAQQPSGAGQFGQNQATQPITNSIGTQNNQYEYSIPSDAIYSTSNLSQFKN